MKLRMIFKITGLMLRIVVIGGGIVGSSIAYYLSEKRVNVTVLERQCVASAASGGSMDSN
jgi:glycine/D-amino acid oxidase-like deaminating enzyme